MLVLISLLVAAQLLMPPVAAYDRVTPQVAADRVARCGAGSVTVRSDVELDADVLVVAGTDPITDQQIACIDRAASFYDVDLPPGAQPRFNAIREARASAVIAGEGRKWLSDHKMLDRLPTYAPGVTNDGAFARKIEDLCHAQGALDSSYGVHAVSPDWVKQQTKKIMLKDGPFTCLLNVTWATGYQLSFIGNEQVGPSNGKGG